MYRTTAISLIIMLSISLMSFAETSMTVALSASASQTNVSCNGESDGIATVVASGGTAPYTYSWTSGGTNATETDLEQGSYVCTITDASAASIQISVTISEPGRLSTTYTKSDVSCNGADGTAIVVVSGGTGPFTYNWYPSGGTNDTATGLIPYGYVCYIADANGCATSEKVLIGEQDGMSTTASQTDVSCNGGTDGYATVVVSGGTAPYTYDWFPAGGTDATANGLSAIGYTCNITDANGCIISEKVILSEPDAIITSSTQTDVSCNGGSNGTATVIASGGSGSFTYEWYPSGGTNPTATGLTAQIWTCIITDANNCIASESPTISEPDVLSASSSKTDVTSSGGSDGTATAVATGGTAPYTYAWSPSGGTDTTATGLTIGDYTVTITDANGCTISELITIDEAIPAPPASNASPLQSSVVAYPNPAGETLSVSNVPADATIILMSLDGNEMMRVPAGTILQTGSLPSGLYTLVIESSEGNRFSKIFKQ